ncbi:MAG: alpha-amylase family glycosyl hydrolase [Ruminococcus sp.]
MKSKSLRLLSLIMVLCMLLGCSIYANAAVTDSKSTSANYENATGIQAKTQDGVILHAFCWSYDTIKDNLSAIAEAGYSTIQTSPVQQPKNYGNWYDVTGQYWKLYQPLSYSVATESWLGTKEDLTELCEEAHKYGIKIICDVVMNHLGNNTNGDTGTLFDGVADVFPEIYKDYQEEYVTKSGNAKYLHNCFNNASDGNVQFITQGFVNNLISLNTGSDYIQELQTGLLKECIDCGVDGFRFDAAKHIETPDDGEYASDYWPNVLGAASEYASETQDGKELFYYGEILNTVGAGRKVESYTKYMSVTDSRVSDSVTSYIHQSNPQSTANLMNKLGDKSIFGSAPDKTVLWAESHDTYLGGSGNTSRISNEEIIKSWALNASRKDATALYFARPGVLMAEVGDLSWKSTAVSEINKFHNKFVGQSESVSYSGDFVYNQRGDSGIVIVNANGNDAEVSLSTTMADGTYTDTITGNSFTVADGTITGKIGSTGIAVVYDGSVSPKVTVSKGNTSFKGDTFTFTATAENADSATYQIGENEPVTFTGTTNITVGEGFEFNTKIPVVLTATKGEQTSTVTYYYEKLKPAGTGLYVFFDNSKTQYSEVYCYVFDRYNNNDNYSINNRSWPGERMDYDEATGLYYYEIPDVSATLTVPDGASTKDVELSLTKSSTAGAIFNNGIGKQYPAQSSSKVLTVNGKNHILNTSNQWGETDFKLGSQYGMSGDCDSNGKVTIADTTYIQKALVGKKNLVSVASKNADVNGDGKVTIEDATLIQKYCLNMNTGFEIGVNKSGDIVEETTPAETVPLPTAGEGKMIFYVVSKYTGSGSLFKDGCKIWICNKDTGEYVETTKQAAETDEATLYSYAEIPTDWKNLEFRRTIWTADTPDSYYNICKPTTKRGDNVNAIKFNTSGSSWSWIENYVPTA